MKGYWKDLNFEETTSPHDRREFEEHLQDIPEVGSKLHNLGCEENFLQEVFHNVADQEQGVIKVQCQGQVYYLWIKEQPGSFDIDELEVYPFDPIRN